MKIIHWIGIDDHADKWTIAHLRGSDEKPTKEFELIPNEAGYRKLLAFAKALGGTVRFVQRCCRPRAPVLERRTLERSYS